MSTSRAILPREYGAYAELAFPLLTAHIAGGVTAAGACFTLAVISWFLAREPLAVLNGVRGARLEASLGRPARRAAWALGGLGAVGAGVGLLLASPDARLWALVPGACAVVLAPALLRGRPKTLRAEIVVAVALATMILPIGLSGRMALVAALRASAVWAASFVLATLAVHAIKARVKPDLGARWALWLTPVLAGLAVVTGFVGAGRGHWPWAVGLAVTPSAVLVATALAVGTHPRRLKRVGWSLAGANLVTLTLLLVA
ncbi:MAG: YwiC-like family protein [Gemmatimonadota bacterium]|nr:YwiC-like family protein [Gemmatimonadota bacterium]MDH4349898.1 YwiC-like family protein [Gemmatimonadota bacterium]MDH5196413.1 YwiC-like family protein [Gemmatimonadota bacterium]